jgi:hypothetical protein
VFSGTSKAANGKPPAVLMANKKQLDDLKGLKMQSKQSENLESNIMANTQTTAECQCKKLIPLTDEQIQEVLGVKYLAEPFIEFVRAIEAAHGIGEKK